MTATDCPSDRSLKLQNAFAIPSWELAIQAVFPPASLTDPALWY